MKGRFLRKVEKRREDDAGIHIISLEFFFGEESEIGKERNEGRWKKSSITREGGKEEEGGVDFCSLGLVVKVLFLPSWLYGA